MGDGRGTASNSGSGVADSDVAEHDEGDSDGTRRDEVDSAAAARAVAAAVEQALADGAAEPPAWATAASPDAAARAGDPESVAARLVARTLRRVLGDADGREPASDSALGSASTSDLPDAVATALADLAAAVESAAVEGETTTGGKVAEGEAAAESEAIARSEAVTRAYGAVVPADRRRTRGEYYTPRPVRDLLARLTVTAADDRVLDPACGTGGFLASAARRKRALAAGGAGGATSGRPGESERLVGVDVAPDPARLAAASLPADVHVADFLDVTPTELGGPFDAVVGNPPYVRHEDIPDDAAVRAHLKRVGAGDLSRRADLYVYFLTRATEFLAPGGDLGLVVSDRWLDTRYGEDVQRFLLDNYAVRAVVTFDRGVFDDALVDASLLVVRRREERAARDRTVTRFVRVREGTDVGAETDAGTGIRGGGAADSDSDAPTVGDLDDADTAPHSTNAPTDGAHDDTDTADRTADSTTTAPHPADDIVAAVTRDRPPDRLADGPGLRVATRRQADLRAEAKWNAYHLAPPVYFDLRRDSGTVPLSALADVRYGVKTGANDFFVAPPDEWTERGLDAYATPFLKATGQVETIGVSPADADGWRVLDAHDAASEAGVPSEDARVPSGDAGLASETAARSLSAAGHPALARYVARGERAGYHERPSLAAREPWFDLGALPRPRLLATTFTWRVHRVHWNVTGAVPSDQFYAIRPDGVEPEVLAGVLNSRPVWLASEVLGRRAGGEGMARLQTKVYEAERWPVPDPRDMTDDRRERVRRAFRALRERESAVENPTAAATAAERDALDRAVLGALEVERDVDELLADVRRGVRTLVARRAGEGDSPAERSVTELPPVDDVG